MMKKLLLVPILLILNLILVNAITFNQDEILGFYEFEEGSGTTALDSANSNDLTHNALYVNPDTARNGTGNFSLFFGGSALADGGDIFSFENDNNISIVAIVNNTVTPTKMAIVSRRFQSGAKNGYFFGVTVSGLLNIEIRHANNNRIDVVSTQIIDDSTWHCVAMTYNGNKTALGTKMFIDGVEEPVTIVKDTLTDTILTSASFNLGSTNGASEFFRGNIDNVAIFQIELTPSQVISICNEGIATIIPPPEPPVVTPEGLDFLVCPLDTTRALLLILFTIMVFFFIWIAIKTGIGFVGFFAAIFLIIISLFYYPCVKFFALLFTLMGLLLIIYFVIKGLGFENKTYKP